MSNHEEFVAREWERFKKVGDPTILDFESEILSICKRFGEQGHSDMSAGITADVS